MPLAAGAEPERSGPTLARLEGGEIFGSFRRMGRPGLAIDDVIVKGKGLPDGSRLNGVNKRVRDAGDIDALYMLFLGRAAESEQVRADNYGKPVLDVAKAMIESEEFRDEVLNRFLDDGALPHDRLSAKALRKVAEFAAEHDFATATPEERALEAYAGQLEPLAGGAFVEAAYRIILGREPDPEGEEHYLARLEAADTSKRQIVAEMLGSDEFRQRGTVMPFGWRSALHQVFAFEPVRRLLDRQYGPAGRKFVAALEPAHAELMLHISAILTAGRRSGMEAIPVRDRLWIRGWALARKGVASIEIAAGEQHLGTACNGLPSAVVAEMFPDWPDAGRSGFAAMIPASELPDGVCVVRVMLRNNAGRTATAELFIERVEDRVDEPVRPALSEAEIEFYQGLLDECDWRPCFCLLMPIAAHDEEAIVAAQATLEVLRDQHYEDWHLLAVARSGGQDIAALQERLVEDFAEIAYRIAVIPGESSHSLAEIVRRSAGGRPPLVIPIAPGVEPTADSLFEFAAASTIAPEVELITSIRAGHGLGLECATLPLLGRGGAGLKDLLTRGAMGLADHFREFASTSRRIRFVLVRSGGRPEMPHSIAVRRGISIRGGNRGITGKPRRYLAENFLNIDLGWTERRHKQELQPLFVQAKQAGGEAQQRLLKQIGRDFSPFISVRRLLDQFPGYDFSVSEILIEFFEKILSISQTVALHWLFDEEFYNKQYPEEENNMGNIRYFSFLIYDVFQKNRPHMLFNNDWCRSACSLPKGTPAFFHYVKEGIFADISPSPFFDPKFYRAMYPNVNKQIEDGTYACSLEHFIMEGSEQGLLPSADWDPEYYLAQYPDVAEGIATGNLRSPFDHWIRCGIAENRSPNPYFDGRYYLDTYPWAAEEIRKCGLLGAFEHFAVFGRRRRWHGRAPLHTLPVPIEYAKALYLKRCELSVFRVRTGGSFHFPQEERPFFSVIIPAYNNFNYNIRVLELLEYAVHYTKAKTGTGIEVVFIDDDSTDDTVRLEEYAKGVVFRRVSPNLGFLRACNLGASLASGTYLVFLNNDVEFQPDIFVRLQEAIEADRAEVACFGAAILQFDGSIQDLGSGIWRDGMAQGYFRNEPPTRYAFAYPRDIDYVAGCFFCISAEEFRAFHGFDERYSPGYYEESDLSLRLWKAGRRSRVYPNIRIYHLEFGSYSSGTTPRASFALMTKNRILFSEKHKDLLDERPELKFNSIYPVRCSNSRLRVLFIEDTVPSVRIGAGFGRSEIIIRQLIEFFDVDIFAVQHEEFTVIPDDFAYLEISFGPSPESLYTVLESKTYDVVFVCRTPNLARYGGVLSAWKRRSGGLVVCDTEAVAAIRDISQRTCAESYSIIISSGDFDSSLQNEFRGTDAADIFVAVNQFEADILRRFARPVHVIGHHLPVKQANSTSASRSGLLFLGALHGVGAPNYDGLVWFLTNVWPKIRASRPGEELRIAGLVRPGIPLEPLQRDGVVCLGPIEDPSAEFASARLFITPTRFAAGIPFKVQEALSYGLPAVTSRLIQDQLRYAGDGCTDALLAATVNDGGREFADACLQLLTDDALWLEKHEAALVYIRRHCAQTLLRDAVSGLLNEVRAGLKSDRIGSASSGGGHNRHRSIDLDQWLSEAILADSHAEIVLERPIGIFVHLFYEDLVEEIAGYLACIDLPKRIYASTDSDEKRRLIIRIFERFDLASVSEIMIVPNRGYDIAPFLIRFADRFSEHDICLKIHGKKSRHSAHEFGKGWRQYLYNELIGNKDRVRAIVASMLADTELGLLMPHHYYRTEGNICIGPNFDPMQKILNEIEIDLLPNQKIEYPSGSMFWFRSDALARLASLGYDWSDFDQELDKKDGTLAHAMERCFPFFCAHAEKRWAFLPLSYMTGPKLSRNETIRLMRESGAFDEAYYCATYSDIAEAGMDPIEHWVDIGWHEGRNPSDPRRPNPVVHGLLEHHVRGLPVTRPLRGGGNHHYKIADRLLQGHSPNLEKATPVIWGPVTDADIRCIKEPSFDGEVALFVTHSPYGCLKPHVTHYVQSLRQQGIAVVLIMQADEPFTAADPYPPARADGIFVRQNKGYDFAAWAHVLRLHRELFAAKILYLLNDSVIGPTDDGTFAALLHSIRESRADFIGLTENYEHGWHIQSYFLAMKPRALSSATFHDFIGQVVCYEDKLDVINEYELRLAPALKATGLRCESMFRAIDSENPTTHHWRYLLRSGFPFLKMTVIRDTIPGVDASGWREILAAEGFDVSLAERTLAEEARS
jgi:lipopolysaccharide biosynthesis protein/GT2 family glycosyltransferase